MYRQAKQMVAEIYQSYLRQREIGAVQAAEQIDQAIGGITAVRFNAGKRFTISNHNFSVSIPCREGKKQERICALAYAGYLKAQQNGSIKPGEVHIGKGISTKHHRENLEALLN